jgi:hypothetical protein
MKIYLIRLAISTAFLFWFAASANAAGFCPINPYSADLTPDYEKCERFCKNDRDYWRASDKTCVEKGFNGVLEQTASNAGDCPTCTLTVHADPTLNNFTLVANNGWTAEMTYNSAGHRGAQGAGRWPESWPEPYKGKPFYVLMGRTGNAWSGYGGGYYTADVTIQTQGVGDISAKFHWRRGSNKPYPKAGFDDWSN